MDTAKAHIARADTQIGGEVMVQGMRSPTVAIGTAGFGFFDGGFEAFCEQIRQFTDRWQPAGPGSVYLVPPPMLADDRLLRWCQTVAGAVRTSGWDPALGVTGAAAASTRARNWALRIIGGPDIS